MPFPIFVTEGSTPLQHHLKPISLQILETSLRALAVFVRHLSTGLQLLYGPTLLYIAIRIIELLCTKEELASLAATATASFKVLANISGDNANKEKIVNAALVTVLDAFK
jgi:hypothetical protein